MQTRTLSLCAGQTFDQLPSSASVLEGGSTEFSCTVLSNDPSPTRLNSVWAILMPGPGRTEQLLGINNINMTDLEGSTAFIGTPFNSPLTIANVTRSLDGTRVRCLFLVGIDPTLQPEPYAFLTVLGKLHTSQSHVVTCTHLDHMLSHAHISITCCHMHTTQSHAVTCTHLDHMLQVLRLLHPVNLICSPTNIAESIVKLISLVHSFSTQPLLCTPSSQTNPPLCWKEKTSPIPLGLKPTQLPPTSPGPEMARSFPVVVG